MAENPLVPEGALPADRVRSLVLTGGESAVYTALAEASERRAAEADAFAKRERSLATYYRQQANVMFNRLALSAPGSTL